MGRIMNIFTNLGAFFPCCLSCFHSHFSHSFTYIFSHLPNPLTHFLHFFENRIFDGIQIDLFTFHFKFLRGGGCFRNHEPKNHIDEKRSRTKSKADEMRKSPRSPIAPSEEKSDERN